jgi:hypothetical protein
MADLSFLSSLTFWTVTCFFFLLWVPIKTVVVKKDMLNGAQYVGNDDWGTLTLASDLGGVSKASGKLLSGVLHFLFYVHQFFRL